MKQRNPVGFTFIEILVAVSIIAVLVMIGVVSYGSVNKRSRDARRKSDIEQMRSALEMYRADTGYYPDEGPTSLETGALSAVDPDFSSALAEYISALPQDPSDDASYPYRISMNDLRGGHYYGYCITASLEGGSDRSARSGAAANTGSNACSVALPYSYDYGMKNP